MGKWLSCCAAIYSSAPRAYHVQCVITVLWVLSLPCRSGFSTEAISSCQKIAIRIWTLVDGKRTMTDVLVEATRLWHLAPGAVQEAALSALVDAQLIRAQLEIPVGLYEPMDYLERALHRVENSEPLVAVVERFQMMRRALHREICHNESRYWGRSTDISRR